MKKLLIALFAVILAALWVAVAGFGLEFYFIMKWRGIEKNNTYVQARNGLRPWPQAVEASLAMPKDYADPPPSPVLPEPDPVAERARRASFFFMLNDSDRILFCNVFGVRVLLYDGAGALKHTYPAELTVEDPATPANLAGARRAEAAAGMLADFAASGKAPARVLVPAVEGELAADVYLFVERGADQGVLQMGVFVEEAWDPRRKEDPNVWEQSYSVFRKHGFRKPQSPNPENLGVEEFRLNNVGFRDDDVVLPKPPGVFRIVCVGASTTEEGPRNALSYPNILERKFAEAFGSGRVEVINCGISGMNIGKERMRLPDYLGLEPDLMIVYEGVNDICHIQFEKWRQRANWWQRILRQSRFAVYYLNGLLMPSDAQMAEELENEMVGQLRFFRDHALRANVPTAFCSFAHPDTAGMTKEERNYFEYYNARGWGGRYVTFDTYIRAIRLFNGLLKAWCERDNVMYIPVAEQVTGGCDVFGDICHMRNTGIERKAQVIFEYLKDYVGSRIAPAADQ